MDGGGGGGDFDSGKFNGFSMNDRKICEKSKNVKNKSAVSNRKNFYYC